MYTLEIPVQGFDGRYYLKSFNRDEIAKLYRQLLLETDEFYVEIESGIVWDSDLILAVDTYNLFNEAERLVWY